MSEDLIARMLSRKFILSLTVLIASTVLVGVGKVDGEQWSDLAMVAMGSFTLGNICEHFANSGKPH